MLPCLNLLSSNTNTSPNRNALKKKRTNRNFKVWAIDAAQPFDSEAQEKAKIEKNRKLKIGLIGFGNFGQFLAKRFVGTGNTVIATSRTNYTSIAKNLGVTYFKDADDFCEEHPDVVILLHKHFIY